MVVQLSYRRGEEHYSLQKKLAIEVNGIGNVELL